MAGLREHSLRLPLPAGVRARLGDVRMEEGIGFPGFLMRHEHL